MEVNKELFLCNIIFQFTGKHVQDCIQRLSYLQCHILTLQEKLLERIKTELHNMIVQLPVIHSIDIKKILIPHYSLLLYVTCVKFE